MVREAYEESTGSDARYETLKKSNIGEILNDDIMRRVMDCITGMNN